MGRSKFKSLLVVVTGGSALFCCHETYKGSPKFYGQLLMPVLQRMTGAETAHNLAIKAAKYGFYPRTTFTSDRLTTDAMGRILDNPIGLSAGFDKHIEAIDGLLDWGFGFLEVGGVTPEPQPGNDKPRVFRLPEDSAIINRYGFNSQGHAAAVVRLEEWHAKHKDSEESRGYIGVNLGKNKTTTDGASDYVRGVKIFGPLADFLVVNVSSPNTKGLRDLQGKAQLTEIMVKVIQARDALECSTKPHVFIKIAPDLTEKDKIDIAEIVTAKNSGIKGLVISNTTITRPESLNNQNKIEMGGLSGAPLRDKSTELIRDMYKLTGGKILIIGVGGVFTGQDAFDKLAAGASLIQIYSALAYKGPPIVNQIKRELDDILKAKGMESVKEAVGIDILKKNK